MKATNMRPAKQGHELVVYGANCARGDARSVKHGSLAGESVASWPGSRGPVGRNKLAQFRHRDSAFAVGLPELRRLVPAYMFRRYFGNVEHPTRNVE